MYTWLIKYIYIQYASYINVLSIVVVGTLILSIHNNGYL